MKNYIVRYADRQADEQTDRWIDGLYLYSLCMWYIYIYKIYGQTIIWHLDLQIYIFYKLLYIVVCLIYKGIW